MGFLTRSLIRRFHQWDRPAQLAISAALVLFIVILTMGALGPPEIRVPAIVGIIGLLLTMQAIVLWANRDLVTPYTEAQRAYLRGDFDAALATLSAEGDKLDAKGLTLMGNTYRQLGRLDESELTLMAALGQLPDDQFPLYGLGRTLLAQGRYPEAVDRLGAALKDGAPDVVRADLGEAFYRAGDTERAKAALQTVLDVEQEAYRRLMVEYLLWRLGEGERPAPALVRDGIEFWQATAERFAHTPYGKTVAADVAGMTG
jgi:tetratricopeptide (TPR) repeat protein